MDMHKWTLGSCNEINPTNLGINTKMYYENHEFSLTLHIGLEI